MSINLGTAHGRILLDTSGVGRGVRQAQGQFGILGRSAHAAGAAVKSGLALGAGLGIVAGLQSTISTVSNFEAGLSNLRAVARPTARDMALLRDQALALGQSTKFSAGEVVAAQGELAKAGISTAQILGGALPAALNLAAAGDLELVAATTVLSDTMGIFGLRATEAIGVADALASAANSTTADVGDFAAALENGAGAAKTAGFSFTDTVVALEALAASGAKGAEAGTNLKSFLNSIASPSKEAQKEMKKLGISFFDVQGKIKPLPKLSAELRDAFGNLKQQEKLAAASTIASSFGMKTLFAIMDAGPKTLQGYEKALTQVGTATETARIKQDNLRGDVEELGGAIETAQIKLAGGLEPALRSVAQTATSAITQIANGEGILGAYSGALFTATGAALDLAGGAASLAGSLAEIPGLFTVIAPAALGAAGALKAASLAQTAFVAASGARIVQTGAAFLSLAGSVRSVSDATTLAKVAMSGLVTPAGLALAGVGALTGVLVAFRGGLLGADSGAKALAASMAAVDEGARRAATAVAEVRGSSDQVADARARVKSTALELERAERTYAQASANGRQKTLEAREAFDRLTQARTSHNRAIRDSSGAEKAHAATVQKRLQDTAESIHETEKSRRGLQARRKEIEETLKRESSASSVHKEYTGKLRENTENLEKNDRKSKTLRGTLSQLQREALKNAASMIISGKGTKEMQAALIALGTASPAGVEKFFRTFNIAMDKGKGKAESGRDGIKAALQKTDTPVTYTQFLASIDDAVSQGEVKANTGAARIRAALASASPEFRNSPSANDLMKAGLHVMSGLVVAGLGGVQRAAEKGAAGVREATKKGVDAIVAEQTNLSIQLDRIDRGEERRIQRNERLKERQRLQAAVGSAKDAKERAAALRDLRDFNERLLDEGNVSRKALVADTTRGGKRERADARQRLGAFDARRALTAKVNVGERIGTLTGDLEQATGDLASRVGDSLDRALSASLAKLDAGLKTDMDAIDSGIKTTLTAIEQGTAASLGGIANLAPGLRAALEGISTGLVATLGPINAAIDTAQGEIDRLQPQIEGIQTRRRERDEGKRRGELTTGKSAADAQVAKLEAVLGRARTDSERQAAQTLLDAAKAEAAVKAQELADFEEDVNLGRLERELAVQEKILSAQQQARDKAIEAATQAANAATEAERTSRQVRFDNERVAEEALYAGKKERLEKALGDLQENLKRRNGEWRNNLAEVESILNDKTVADSIETSGKKLGLAFIEGLKETRKGVGKAAEALAREVADYLKLKSPADKGPLAFDFGKSGIALGEDFGRSLWSTKDLVGKAAAGVAQAAAMEFETSERLAARQAASVANARMGAQSEAERVFARYSTSAAGSAGAQQPLVGEQHLHFPQGTDPRTAAQRAYFEARMAGGAR